MQKGGRNKMIELEKMYSSKELAQEIGISYGTFRNKRSIQEKHLQYFYDYEIINKGNNICYIFHEQYGDFIPYREYSNLKRKKLFQDKIKATIDTDSRQTGSNIARIISVDGEIQALDLQLSTLTCYTRINLKELVEQGYYVKTDYRWCYLNPSKDAYVLMNDEEVKILRKMFNFKENAANEENILTDLKEGNITKDEAYTRIGEEMNRRFVSGLQQYYVEYGVRPIKVPVYERRAW